MSNSKKYSRVMSMVIAVAMVFSVMVFMPEDVSAASKKPGKVKITKATKMNQMITVTWKKTNGAKKYQVYVKAGKKKWKKVATVKANGKSRQTYNIKRCKWNTVYQIKMRAVNGKKKGKWSVTYKGKLAKKTTLQALINSHAAAKKELQDLQREINADPEMSGNVYVRGNTVVIQWNFVGSAFDFSNDLAKVRHEYKNLFVNAKEKKSMKKLITEFEDICGIFGIKIRLIISDSVGNKLLDYTYK